jgi:hypothetical protein
MKINVGVFGFILLLNASFLRAEINVFCSAGAGILISSSQTARGTIEGSTTIDSSGNLYKYEQEDPAGYGAIFSMHVGISGLGSLISLETGLDFCLGNKKEVIINFKDYPIGKLEMKYYYLYSSLDIPILAAMPLTITDSFIIRPAAGLYVSIPFGEARYHQEAKGFNDPSITEYCEITSAAIAGFEGDIKFIYEFKRIKSRGFLGCNFKYDLNPLHGISNDNEHWSLDRQALSFSVGYEYAF